LVFFPEKFTGVDKFTLMRKFEFINEKVETYMQIDKASLGRIIKATDSEIIETRDGKHAIDFDVEETLCQKDVNNEMAKVFHAYCPEIIFFNDFSDMLPDKIKISEIYDESNVAGKHAVKNIEKILGIFFIDYSIQSVRHKNSNIEKASKQISIEFLNDWNQRIDNNTELKIGFNVEKNYSGEDEVHFYIETKEGVKLEPRKRSRGLLWFLSLWLEIKAESKNYVPMVLLFDEPGLHLHVNAMKDMTSLFDKLSVQGHQILYSTHLPSMIDLDNLQNIRLVIHDKVKGTQIEKLTSSRFNSQIKRDALQPIAQAMGMQPLTEFSVLRQKNVIVEGLSDMLYLNAMKKMLGKSDDYAFVPGLGAKNEKLNSLISFCIGYGLDWLVLLDNGYHPSEFIKQLNKSLESQEELETNQKIYVTDEKEIEDLFHLDDFKLLNIPLTGGSQKSVSDLIGTKRKFLFSQTFSNTVNEKVIKKSTLNKQTIENFEAIFGWIEKSFGIKK
jgi:hypothetical protein